MLSGDAKNKRAGLRENNKQSHLEVLQESFKRVWFKLINTLLKSQCLAAEGISFMCTGGIIQLEIFCLIIFDLITAFQKCDTFLLPK